MRSRTARVSQNAPTPTCSRRPDGPERQAQSQGTSADQNPEEAKERPRLPLEDFSLHAVRHRIVPHGRKRRFAPFSNRSSPFREAEVLKDGGKHHHDGARQNEIHSLGGLPAGSSLGASSLVIFW